MTLELNLSPKHVRGRPGLGKSETVEVVHGLDVAGDSGTNTRDWSPRAEVDVPSIADAGMFRSAMPVDVVGA